MYSLDGRLSNLSNWGGGGAYLKNTYEAVSSWVDPFKQVGAEVGVLWGRKGLGKSVEILQTCEKIWCWKECV